MSKNCRGKALIINNDIFAESEKLSSRKGSHIDVERMVSLFQQLHFDIRCFNNLTAEVRIVWSATVSEVSIDSFIPILLCCVVMQ